MYNFYVPTQDSSIYSEFTGINTGLDEQLEVGKPSDGTTGSIRSLIQFDMTPIIAGISSSIIPLSAVYEMRLYVSLAAQLKKYTILQFSQISQSWEEGQGYFAQQNFFDGSGVTWYNTTSGSMWAYPGGTTGSLRLTSTASLPLGDFYINVTPFVQSWLSGTANYGILVQFDSGSEQDPNNNGNIKFFSKDTHTIFQPQLVVKWQDQIYLTSSMTASSLNNTTIIAQSMKTQYRQNEFAHIDLVVRDRYPLKSFDTFFDDWVGDRFPPSSSYFQVIDDQTGVTIIPYSDQSRVSVNNSNAYIEFNIQQMYPLRYYRVFVKTLTSGTLSQVYDLGNFRVTT